MLSVLPTSTPADRLYRWWRAAIFIGVPAGFGLYAITLGRDANWDLQNYHWYNADALLHWRYDRDVAPAMGMSFFAPLFYVPWYVLGTVLPARALGFIMGAVYSANLLLLYAIARIMLPVERRTVREAVSLAVAFAGMLGGMSMGLFATTFLDGLMAIGILGSILAVVTWLPALISAPPARAARLAALAAIPAALAVSGKLTMCIFAVGLAAGFLVVDAPLRRRLWLLLWFGIGGTIVAAIAVGPWLWHLWSTTGDPFFPFYARLFNSPLGGDAWNFDRWGLRKPQQAFYFPLIIGLYGTSVAEVPFVDFRFLAAYVVVPGALVLRMLRPKQRAPLAQGFGYLIVTMVVTYVLWMVMFRYYRYVVALELLAPLAVALAVMALPFAWPMRAGALALVLLGLLATTQRAEWGHLPWTAKFVEVSVPPIDDPPTATVLLMGQPISFVVPSLPPPVAVIAIEMATWDGANQQAWTRITRDRLASRQGAIYAILFTGKETEFDRLAIPFGLRLTAARCQPLPANLPAAGVPLKNPLSFCPVERVGGTQQ